ncbi:MAG: DUF4258 domain-containing protein [Methanosarcinales archaeon Met12]|nr:MAG: DUF4258 domain-containing protein [Methanosarcinales archaeon Met12]
MRFKRHASERLIKRFQMSSDEVRHHIKTGKHIKKPEKEGNIGIIQSKIRDSQIRFVYVVRNKILWIITIEET